MKYVRLVKWSSSNDGVRLEMVGDDQQEHKIDIGAECVGVVGAALTGESQRFDSQDNPEQLLRPVAMQTARTEAGEPMILLGLAGGAELPLVFKPESLGVLVAELQKLMGAVQPDSQIRWQ